jgi:hypothetical protein
MPFQGSMRALLERAQRESVTVAAFEAAIDTALTEVHELVKAIRFRVRGRSVLEQRRLSIFCLTERRWKDCEDLIRCSSHGIWDVDCDAIAAANPEWQELQDVLQNRLDLANTVSVFGLAQNVVLVITIVDLKSAGHRYRLTRHQKIAVSHEEYDGLAALEAALRLYETPAKRNG